MCSDSTHGIYISNTEIDAHVRSEMGHLICLRHLFKFELPSNIVTMPKQKSRAASKNTGGGLCLQPLDLFDMLGAFVYITTIQYS